MPTVADSIFTKVVIWHVVVCILCNVNYCYSQELEEALWYDLKSIVFQIQKKLDQEEATQSKESTTEPTDSGCETLSEEDDSAVLWVEKYKPKSYLELLSDEVNS